MQKLVSSLSQELLAHLSEEAFHTEAYTLDTPRLNDVLLELAAEFSASFVNQQLLSEATAKSSIRVAKRAVLYQSTVGCISFGCFHSFDGVFRSLRSSMWC